jgi:hypothetical protein
MHFESNFSPEFTIADSWEFKHLFKHDWAFNGPWFTGNLANLSMSLNIIRPKKSVAAARITGVSFFHPRAFEQAVGDYLTNRYSIHKTDGRAEWIAPVNWQPLTALPTMAVRLLVCRDEEVTYSRHHEFVFFAISDQQLGVITFWPSQRAMGTQAEQDAEVGRESMNDLMDNIIASLQIELSAEAAAAQSEALKGLDDTSLVKEFLPMKWTSAEEDALWESQNNKKCISN